MENDPAEPTTCPDCGHPVYRPMMAPVRHPQRSCRAVVSGTRADAIRCDCRNFAHRSPTVRPRHRLDPPLQPAGSGLSTATRA
jgi:hypothetical protein